MTVNRLAHCLRILRFPGLVFLCLIVIGYASFGTQRALASRLHKETAYQQKWCGQAGGVTEVRQPDLTRVDCLTSRYAIEFDFGSKWAEAIGQSLHYAIQTGKQPGIVLILEKKSDLRYWNRLNSVIQRFELEIKTWKMAPGDL